MVFINTYFPALENLWKKPQKYLHQGSPSGNPPSGQCYFWCKTDNKLYLKDSSGNESEVGGIGGAGVGTWKAPVLNATTADITLSGEQTIDGILTSESRILVKNQTNAEENGIYVTNASVWARASDANLTQDFSNGLLVLVKTGTDNLEQIFFLITNGAITVGTTELTFTNMNTQKRYFTEVLLATQAVAEAGTVTSNRRFTPERIKQAIAALETGEINPALISQADAEAGTATDERVISAERMKQSIDALAAGASASSNITIEGRTETLGTWLKIL